MFSWVAKETIGKRGGQDTEERRKFKSTILGIDFQGIRSTQPRQDKKRDRISRICLKRYIYIFICINIIKIRNLLWFYC